MKKIAALSTVALLALLAGCQADRVDNAGTTTNVETCEKAESCCKATKSKSDCKSDCSESDCADGKKMN